MDIYAEGLNETTKSAGHLMSRPILELDTSRLQISICIMAIYNVTTAIYKCLSHTLRIERSADDTGFSLGHRPFIQFKFKKVIVWICLKMLRLRQRC